MDLRMVPIEGMPPADDGACS